MKAGSQGREFIVVQLPRGRTVVVGFDPAEKRIFSNHQGLFGSLFRHGVRALDGRLLFPPDGRDFLCAAYDVLFLNGYGVRWMRATTAFDASMRPTT